MREVSPVGGRRRSRIVTDHDHTKKGRGNTRLPLPFGKRFQMSYASSDEAPPASSLDPSWLPWSLSMGTSSPDSLTVNAL